MGEEVTRLANWSVKVSGAFSERSFAKRKLFRKSRELINDIVFLLFFEFVALHPSLFRHFNFFFYSLKTMLIKLYYVIRPPPHICSSYKFNNRKGTCSL